MKSCVDSEEIKRRDSPRVSKAGYTLLSWHIWLTASDVDFDHFYSNLCRYTYKLLRFLTDGMVDLLVLPWRFYGT